METQEQKEEIQKDAEVVVEAVKEMVKDTEQEAAPPDVLERVAEAQAKERRVAELKDELERLETGLPNAGATIRSIKAKQQRVPGRKPNTPDVNPGDVGEITAQEMIKYAGALGTSSVMPGMMPGGGMAMPGMAAQPGPRGPVGPQMHTPPPQVSKPHTVQLDPKTLLEVELVSVKKRLAEANERLSIVALNDARKAKFAAEQQEAELLAAISRQLDIPPGKNVRLIDKQKGICVIEE